MQSAQYLRSAVEWLAASVGLCAFTYVCYVVTAWCRYGYAKQPAGNDETDPLLDQFMPKYDVVERHHIRVSAPAETAFSAATDLHLSESAVIQAIFKSRELVLRARPNTLARPRTLLAQMKALGWGVLSEIPDYEIVMGAATQPWIANVVMRALPPDRFAAFCEPGYAKIAWTLRADPIGAEESVARTETRVVTTDPAARAKFRRYWSFFSPGILLIRHISLSLVKKEAERRARTSGNSHPSTPRA